MAIDRTVVDRGEGTAVVFTHGTLMDHTMFAPFDLEQQENVLRDYGKVDVGGLLPHDVIEVAVARCFGGTTIERNPQLVAHWVARWRELPARSVYNEVRSWVGKADHRPGLANIDVPALILHGEEDSIFPVGIAEELEAEIPNARLIAIPLAGH